MATPPGFVKSTIPLDAPPVGLAFDADGVLVRARRCVVRQQRGDFAGDPAGWIVSARAISVMGDDPSNFFRRRHGVRPGRRSIAHLRQHGRRSAVCRGANSACSKRSAWASPASRESRFATRAKSSSPLRRLAAGRSAASRSHDWRWRRPCSVGLGFGAGLAFDLGDNLIVQDANTTTFLGRLQRLANH